MKGRPLGPGGRVVGFLDAFCFLNKKNSKRAKGKRTRGDMFLFEVGITIQLL